MASDAFKTLVLGFILFSLFGFIMLQWIGQMGTLNSVDTSEISRGSLNPEDFNNSIITVNNTGQTARNVFETGGVEDIDAPQGVFEVVKSIGNMVSAPFVLIGSVLEALEVPTIVINVIVGILSILLILAVWGLLRKGD